MIARNRSRRRRGFTLVELLTVIAIIGLLMALAIGAYFRVRVSQEEASTETTIAKVHSQLDQQWRSVLDSAKDELSNVRRTNLPANVIALGEGDNGRVNVIWTKIRLKQEFPQTFFEALVWPAQVSNQMVPGANMQPPPLPQPYVNFPLPSKYAALIPLAQNTLPRDPSTDPTFTAYDQHKESAALLYLAITKARRGNAGFNPSEHVGAHAVGTINIQVTTAGDLRPFDVFLDTWGNPISFIRWPFGGRATDVNQPPNLQLNKQGQPIDPQDPEKWLFAPKWNNNLRTAFINTVRHPIDLNYAPLNLSPVVFSWGRDKIPGVDADGPSGPNHLMPLTGEEYDNIYSHRIKAGRGNN